MAKIDCSLPIHVYFRKLQNQKRKYGDENICLQISVWQTKKKQAEKKKKIIHENRARIIHLYGHFQFEL